MGGAQLVVGDGLTFVTGFHADSGAETASRAKSYRRRATGMLR
jgi:hypothetical protein